MALIKCPECQKEISEQATSCPSCGCPISPAKVVQKYCKHCGELIDKDCVICPKCGKQVEDLNNSHDDRNIIINNNNSASASAAASNINAVPYYAMKKPKNKWVSLLLCIFTVFGHKFYEGKIGMGILYIFTCGLFGIGWVIDIISLLLKPNPYYI